MMSSNPHAALYTDYYELTMAQGYFLTGMSEKKACFDYFFRRLPFKGGYVVFAGLYDLLEILQSFEFQKEELDYLKEQGFNRDFLSYLGQFRFKGSLYSATEGEIIFPNEVESRYRISSGSGNYKTNFITNSSINIAILSYFYICCYIISKRGSSNTNTTIRS